MRVHIHQLPSKLTDGQSRDYDIVIDGHDNIVALKQKIYEQTRVPPEFLAVYSGKGTGQHPLLRDEDLVHRAFKAAAHAAGETPQSYGPHFTVSIDESGSPAVEGQLPSEKRAPPTA